MNFSARPIVWLHTWAQEITVFGLLAVTYATYSINRHVMVDSTSYDLGVFVQNVRGWAEFTGPVSNIKGPDFPLLGDHFSPILALLAPLWWVWPSAIMLLVVQAVLLALGVVPLMVWARRELGRVPAVLTGLIYGLSFGIQSAVAFDFHENSFAVPLISLSVCLLGQKRYRGALLSAAPLVLVKEDLGITYIAVLGAILFVKGARRLGLIAIVCGVMASTIAIKVIIPAFNPNGVYLYAGMFGSNPFSMARYLFENAGVKVATLITCLAVSAFLAARSLIVLFALSNLAARFVSTRSIDWAAEYHYNSVLMPIIVGAMIDAIVLISPDRDSRRSLYRWALPTALGVALLTSVGNPVGLMLKPSYWDRVSNPSAHVLAMREAVALVPSGAVVAASDHLGPQLAGRATVYFLMVTTVSDTRPKWIVADMSEDFPESHQTRAEYIQRAIDDGYEVVFQRDDALVLRDGRG